VEGRDPDISPDSPDDAAPAPREVVTVYSRPGCHLCDEAVERIREMASQGAPIDLEIVDIDRDDELTKRYLERIPVVELGGELISELVFDDEKMRSRLGIA
jgi:glutaredoxin